MSTKIEHEGQVWCPIYRSFKPWIRLKELSKIYQTKSCNIS